MRWFLKTIIRVYQLVISPFLPQSCRFYPTCSAYAFQAVERYGAFKGGILGLKRICKCHPWYKGNIIDPVPDKDDTGN